MKKKTIFLLLILTGILPIACCPESPSGPYLLEFKQVFLYNEMYIKEAYPQYPEYVLTPNDTYTGDTLLLGLSFISSLAQNSNNFSFQSSAYALSCDEYMSLTTLHDKIKDITVTSDSKFNEVNAGELLNSKVISFSTDYNSPISLMELASTINSIEGNEFTNIRYRYLTTLAFIEKPTSSGERTFTVTINYESGKQEVAKSDSIIW